ncbi:MAG: hypothetical protein KAJ19_05140 [Gammaproteobacteria bacterium]|nr:hypothetical protein [Gammaproteobacteria bacterium]
MEELLEKAIFKIIDALYIQGKTKVQKINNLEKYINSISETDFIEILSLHDDLSFFFEGMPMAFGFLGIKEQGGRKMFQACHIVRLYKKLNEKPKRQNLNKRSNQLQKALCSLATTASMHPEVNSLNGILKAQITDKYKALKRRLSHLPYHKNIERLEKKEIVQIESGTHWAQEYENVIFGESRRRNREKTT